MIYIFRTFDISKKKIKNLCFKYLNFINFVFRTRHLCDFRSSCDRVSQVEHEPTRRHNLENHMPTKRNKPPPWQKNLDVRNMRETDTDTSRKMDRQTREKCWCHFFMVLLSGPPRSFCHWTRLHIVKEQVQVCRYYKGGILWSCGWRISKVSKQEKQWN